MNKSSFKKYKNIIITMLVVILGGLLLWIGHSVTTNGEQIFGKFAGAPVEQATIQEVMYEETYKQNIGIEKHIFFKAKVRGGEQKGEVIRGRQILNSMYSTPVKEIEEGDRVMICYTPYGMEKIWVFQEYDRSGPLFGLLLGFFALLLIFGGKKGLSTLLSLVLTCACVFYYFIPAILSGQNIYVATILTCLFIITVTLILVNGINFKSVSAAVGCLGGLLFAGVLFFVMDHFLRLTGMVDEETAYLTMMGIPFDLKAMIFSSVAIGVLGGVLDVGVSIAASLSEIYPEGKGVYEFKQIMKSGINIGRDILCTMTNTLILVYIGSALSLTLLLTVYSNSIFEMINREVITTEILSALLGSIGLVFTIPITTFFYALGATSSKYTDAPSVPLPDPAPLEVREIPQRLMDEYETVENMVDTTLQKE